MKNKRHISISLTQLIENTAKRIAQNEGIPIELALPKALDGIKLWLQIGLIKEESGRVFGPLLDKINKELTKLEK